MCFAWWVKANPGKLSMYIRFRKISYWWNALFLFALALGHNILSQKLELQQYLLIFVSIIDIVLLIVVLSLDSHFSQVLESYAEGLKRTTPLDEESSSFE